MNRLALTMSYVIPSSCTGKRSRPSFLIWRGDLHQSVNQSKQSKLCRILFWLKVFLPRISVDILTQFADRSR